MVVETKVKSGGTWRTITDPQVKSGGTWRTIQQIQVKRSGTWRTVFELSVVSVIVAPNKDIHNLLVDTFTQADVRVDNDGDLWESDGGGTFTSYETWLDAGLNSQVWVERTIISGTLNVDAGSGRLACTADRVFGVTQSFEGTKTCVIDLDFWDAASGGSLLDTQRVDLEARYFSL